MISLTSITIYPIKACAGVNLQHSTVDRLGLTDDRRYVVVDESGAAVTQRENRSLREVTPSVSGGKLRISAPGMPVFGVENSQGPPITLKVWQDTCVASDCGDMAAEWFSDYLKKSCRFVYAGDGFQRPVNKTYDAGENHTAFTDGFPMLLISEESLDDLNSRSPVKLVMERFRPNLVVKGCRPYGEDTWKSIKIGELPASVVKPCARCMVTTIDPETGETSKEPLRTLATYRRDATGEVMFGQNVIHQNSSATIRVGDEVTIL